ncbi:right-handed parallel beta-helix repeat-containing protein [Actinospica sp. MGRD01-02]|uniref:Right-handed parallel beta-helix repeat-containing protein n=1 Tax=Actinospica acidithermotolerans TaxID=2828514 RepID=A0A941IGP8_9ACTN|nr:right-handed parallel beta-helix repeat-containing protein [Actinospica acidithermotolerans]MBR7827640.1 right-handed parallel beta-helix repeat-containing protein [Actinospica acidithermotolerans]
MGETGSERNSTAARLLEAEPPRSPAAPPAAAVRRREPSRRIALAAVLVAALLAVGGYRALWPRGPLVAFSTGDRLFGPRTFYLSPDGSDSAAGTSPESAWRTLRQADKHAFKPGERLLLQGGARFTGSLTFHRGEAGDPRDPVIVGSYGSGRATIAAAGGPGVDVYDTAGIDIGSLVLTGGTPADRTVSGIALFSDLVKGPKLQHVSVTDVDVSGFRVGVSMGGASVGAGFRDVQVTDSVLHGNRDSGLSSFGPHFDAASPQYANENVLVSGVQAFANLGNPLDHLHNTGNGIDLGSVRDAIVERSVAHGNGKYCDAPEGPVGIWVYDSTGVVIQHNVSYDNYSGGYTDGGGFDLDQNVSDSVAQYNYSHDNDGPGFLLYTGADNNAFARNTVRFNVSRDDSRKFPLYASFALVGRIIDASVYHNTVLTHGDADAAPVLRLGDGLRGVTIRDNIFETSGSEMIAASYRFSPAQVLLQGNDYHVGDTGTWLVGWGARSFHSLAAWAGRTGQETAAARLVGWDLDPGLVLVAAPAWDPTRTPLPAPRTGSPITGSGLDLQARFAVDIGPMDYFGAAPGSATTPGAGQPAPAP